jgi:hypothetical protein
MLRKRATILVAAAAAALLAPGLALAGGTIEGFYGIARPPSTSFSAAVEGTPGPSNVFKDSLQLAGGDVLFDLGGLELGVIADVNWANNSASQTAIGGLAGIKLPLGTAHLDLLGEVGGHRYGNFVENPDIVTASKKEQWLAYVGLRPGIAFPLGSGGKGFMLGIWTYARWDLQKGTVPVTLAGGGSGELKLGGVSIGAALRAGFDF